MPQIPASKVVKCLELEGSWDVVAPLRTSDWKCANSALDWAEAYRLACNGDIEAITTNSGRLRMYRLLSDDEREPKPNVGPDGEEIDAGHSTAFAVTRMGVRREELREAIAAYLGTR